MDVDVEVSADIARPIAEVSAYAGDPSNAPEWYVNIVSADWETPPPLALGSRIHFKARFLGRDLVYTYEVVELEPGARLAMRVDQGPFPMETVYTWAAVDAETTRMTLRNRGRPTGFSRLAAPIIRRAMRTAMTADLKSLKQVLERK